PVGYELPHVLARIESGAGLVDVGDPHRVAEHELAGVWLFLTNEHAEERGLADTVRTDDADYPPPWQREIPPLDTQPAPVAFNQLLRFQHIAAKPWAGRDIDLLEVELAAALSLRPQLFVARQPRSVLGLTCLRVRP